MLYSILGIFFLITCHNCANFNKCNEENRQIIQGFSKIVSKDNKYHLFGSLRDGRYREYFHRPRDVTLTIKLI